MSKVTVLICALNEAENLPCVLPGIPGWIDEVMLVDGHSTDGTVETAKRLCPRIRVGYQPGKGKGDALKFGIARARGDIIVTLDADGSTDPGEMQNFIKPLLDGYDFAKGSRFLIRPPNMPLHRRLGNRILVMTTNLLCGTSYTDMCSGYNAFRRQALTQISLSRDGFEMEQELNIKVIKAGLRVTEVACSDSGRRRGNSKTRSFRQGVRDLATILQECLRG